MGLIPARAGTTGDGVLLDEHSGAHPRSRGDHYWCSLLKPSSLGSSPLARGPQQALFCQHTEAGLIPARAGTTACLMKWQKMPRAHPRSRGDHPACAAAFALWGGAHPRSRGDHGRAAPGFCASEGSSPLARGPPTGGIEQLNRVGLIPARAGTTLAQCEKQCHRRAHPRSRGDHNVCASTLKRQRGSSPLARGPLASTVDIEARAGLIPARAGTTVSLAVCSVARRAHPRSRGDHAPSFMKQTDHAGSSPLARGPRGDIL